MTKAAGPDRKPLVAGNWKLHNNHLEAIALVQKLAFSLKPQHFDAVEVTVLPPFTDIRSVQSLIEGDKLRLNYGAQDLSPNQPGAYTGDIAGAMLAKLGCSYVVIGHSERREYHGESDELVNAKVKAAYAHGLVPILCIGERLDVREAGGQVEHCVNQLTAALTGIPADQAARIVVAYEPVWAIGTGRNATPAQAGEAHGHIRSRLRQWFGADAADQCHVIYGGSVKPDNIAELMREPDVDGGLVGGASLEVRSFVDIVTNSRPATV